MQEGRIHQPQQIIPAISKLFVLQKAYDWMSSVVNLGRSPYHGHSTHTRQTQLRHIEEGCFSNQHLTQFRKIDSTRTHRTYYPKPIPLHAGMNLCLSQKEQVLEDLHHSPIQTELDKVSFFIPMKE